jgi:hypothetical protein
MLSEKEFVINVASGHNDRILLEELFRFVQKEPLGKRVSRSSPGLHLGQDRAQQSRERFTAMRTKSSEFKRSRCQAKEQQAPAVEILPEAFKGKAREKTKFQSEQRYATEYIFT